MINSDCEQFFVDAPSIPVPELAPEDDEEDIYNVDNLPLPAPPGETLILRSVVDTEEEEEEEDDEDDENEDEDEDDSNDDTQTIAPSVVSSIGLLFNIILIDHY